MPCPSIDPSIRPGIRCWRVLMIIGLLFNLASLTGQNPTPGAVASAHAGLTAIEWQSIQAELTAPGRSTSVPQMYLKANNLEPDDRFGEAVAIDGDTLVVGARYEDSNGSSPSDNSAPYAGAAYVFVRSNSKWIFQAYLKASNPEEWDTFGSAVAVTWGDGTTGITGTVSSTNNLVGSTASDQVGSQGITALINGNYVVRTPTWNNGALEDTGAVTWGDGTSGVAGIITGANSVRGRAVNGGEAMTVAYDSVNHQLVVGRPRENILTFWQIAAQTFTTYLPVLSH